MCAGDQREARGAVLGEEDGAKQGGAEGARPGRGRAGPRPHHLASRLSSRAEDHQAGARQGEGEGVRWRGTPWLGPACIEGGVLAQRRFMSIPGGFCTPAHTCCSWVRGGWLHLELDQAYCPAVPLLPREAATDSGVFGLAVDFSRASGCKKTRDASTSTYTYLPRSRDTDRGYSPGILLESFGKGK